MAIIPKLALIPSGYKDGSPGKLYSVLPTDGAGDFDVTRGSDATRINKDGLIEVVTGNTPRLDYPLINGVVNGCPSLLLEPASTNLITQSENFSSFIQNGCSVISDDISFTLGGLADKIQEDSSNTNKHVRPSNCSILSGQSYIMSAWFKTDNCDVIAFREGSSSGDSIIYKFSTKTPSFFGTRWNNLKVVDYQNGWMRIEAKYTSTTNASMNFRVHLLGNDYNQAANPNPSTYTYQGNGTSGVYMWGLTVEQQSYATSYIPTSGSAQTRLAETANGAGNASTFNDSEGVLFADIAALANDSTFKQVGIGNGTTGNEINISYDSLANRVSGVYRVGSSYQVNLFVDNNINTQFNKILFKYKSLDFSIWINGFERKVNTTNSTMISGLNNLKFASGSGAAPFYGNTKQIQYYNTALTDSELETLTSYTSFNAMALALNYTI